jgi:hypothetical protein
LPPLRRFFPIGSSYDPFRPGLVSVLSRMGLCHKGFALRCRNVSPFIGNAKLHGASVEALFGLVEFHLPDVDGPVPGISHPVPLIRDLIAPVSNKIALVSGPRELVVV